MCEEIPDDAWLVRAIPEREVDPTTGQLTSFSFNSAQLSVSRFSYPSIQTLLNRGTYALLAAVNAGFCRSIGLQLVPDATPDDPYHVLIIMASGRGSRATKLKRHAVHVPVASDSATTHKQLVDAIASVSQSI